MDRERLKLLIKESARKENIGFFITESRKRKSYNTKPTHTFRTDDGNTIDVYIKSKENGGIAVYKNRDLNNGIVKTLHWFHPSAYPTDSEIEHDIHNNQLNETHIPVDSDTGGKLAEHHAMIHLIDHVHKQNGTLNTPEHINQRQPHIDEITKLSQGRDPDQVQTRVTHGQKIAEASINHLQEVHGKGIKILRVGHISKSGDIGRFTNNNHKDGQENPSDLAVEIQKGNKAQYHGLSLKSMTTSSGHTSSQPGIAFDGMLDHHSRKLNTESISRSSIQDVANKMNLGHMSAAERRRHIDTIRSFEGKSSRSSIEVEANKHAQKGKEDVAKELHDHVYHLTTNTGEEGHHMIGRMLMHHLGLNTSMPYITVKAKGKTPDKTKVQISDDTPIKEILSNPKTRYSSERKGQKVTFFAHHGDKITPIAHYSAKPDRNVLKSSLHLWNVRMANNRSKNATS